MSMFNC